MTILALILLVGWIPAVLPLFAVLPRRRAVVFAYVTAWLFLPNVGLNIPAFPDLTKVSATSVGILLGSLLFDGGRVAAFRPRWVDLPMACFCVCPMFTSLANGLGAYDGFSAALGQTVTWGLPYFIGRLYLSDLDGLRALAVGVVVGGLSYVPFCLWEIRMSPQLQTWLYGTRWLNNTFRFGGYRPVVFMSDGLEVGMWMTAASLAGIWSWKAGTLKQVAGHPFGWPLVGLVVTTVLCKSTGSLVLLIVGIGILWTVVRLKSPIPAIILIALVLGYIGGRSTGVWTGKDLVAFIRTQFDEDRAQSFEFRLDNETILIEKAMERPLLGWGGWGRARVINDEGRDLSVTDGLWIITFGNYGFLGLSSLYTAFVMPLGLMIWKYPARLWKHPAVAPAAALAVLVGLYAVDCLSNGMLNPIYVLAIGGLTGLGSTGRREDEESLEEGVGGSGRERVAFDDAVSSGTEADRRERISRIEESCIDRPDDPGPRHALAVAYDDLARFLRDGGRPAEADDAWSKADQLLAVVALSDPGDSEILRARADGLNDWAWSLVNASEPRLRDPDRAVALVEKAIALRPEHGAYWNTLGLAQLRRRDAKAAVAAVETSIRLDGGSCHDYVLLSIAFYQSGEMALARRWFASAVARISSGEAMSPDLARLFAEAEALLIVARTDDAPPAIN